MTAILPVLFSFIIALAIGIYIGKLIFSAKMQAVKIGLEEKVLASQAQIQNLKGNLETLNSVYGGMLTAMGK